VADAIASGWVSSGGPYVERFATAVARRVNRKHGLATASGTCALDLVLRALRLSPGDEVVVPALSFAAPASAVAAVGLTPLFADVTEDTWTLDADDVKRRLTARTKAIIAVDVLGHPCDHDALAALGLPIVEDAAEAHGAAYRGRPVGSCGVASIFSFHANKAISTGEGGCVVTDDDRIADRIAVLNNHGMRPERPYVHEEIGHNYRMSNLTAAVGLAQVERWDELVAARNAVSAAYDEALAGLALQRRPVAQWAREATWLHTVASDCRTEILAACAAADVDARALWPPIPDQPAFAKWAKGDYPVARDVAARALWLPTWAGMPETAITRVVDAVRGGFGEPRIAAGAVAGRASARGPRRG
jgi:perosamine synthetase